MPSASRGSGAVHDALDSIDLRLDLHDLVPWSRRLCPEGRHFYWYRRRGSLLLLNTTRARAHTPDPQAQGPRSLWTEVWPTQPMLTLDVLTPAVNRRSLGEERAPGWRLCQTPRMVTPTTTFFSTDTKPPHDPLGLDVGGTEDGSEDCSDEHIQRLRLRGCARTAECPRARSQKAVAKQGRHLEGGSN